MASFVWLSLLLMFLGDQVTGRLREYSLDTCLEFAQRKCISETGGLNALLAFLGKSPLQAEEGCRDAGKTECPKQVADINAFLNLFGNNVKAIRISITNHVPDIAFTNVSYDAAIKSNGTLIEVMEKLQKKNKNFWFETVEYPNLGKLITLINGLEQNTERKTYWALGKKIENKLCLLSVGASSYYPQPDEHIIFAYIPINMFKILESCDGGRSHDSLNVRISVENTIPHVHFVNTSYNTESKMNTSLINIMKELNKTHHNFSFTTKEYPGLGEMITSINGLEQDSTMKTYWAIGKMVEGKLCLLPVGASSYYPDENEHIICFYITYDRKFPSCDKGRKWSNLYVVKA